MMVPMTEYFLQYVLRLVFALFIGGLIGIEREVKGKSAGMRTNMLICMASCLLMILSLEIFREGSWFGDPSRIASQVVTGIGFLGAGTIIQSRFSVAGLTSAATIWFVAAIGLMIGWGDFALASATTILIIVTLTILGGIERMVAVKQRHHILQFQFPAELHKMDDAKRVFMANRIHPENLSLKRGAEKILVALEYDAPDRKHYRIVESIREISDVEILLDY
jgi:putative Mg2+ transporter-C (MgtC) family protein